MKVQVTQEELKRLFRYDPETGQFHRLVNTNRRNHSDVAGTTMPSGRIRVVINKQGYLAHRLAWLYVYGRWPSTDIDHINCDQSDNRIANLREASPSENHANVKRHRHNTTGFKGVHRYSHDPRRWSAGITVRGKFRYLGVFNTAEEAHAAYCQAASDAFGRFARFA